MRHRIYTVKLSALNIGQPVDIPVEGPVGVLPAGAPPTSLNFKPVPVGPDGFYVEWRNRPLRVLQKALLVPSGNPNPAFAPFLRLGFHLSIVPMDGGGTTAPLPDVQLSQSLVGNVFTSPVGATSAGDGGFPDPAGKPTIRVLNAGVNVGGRIYRVFLSIAEAKDDDRDNTGSV